jgi:hypothetical protein
VLTEDVAAVVRRAVDPDDGDTVKALAERAETSTRTIYRVLGHEKCHLDLDLADRLVLAAGGNLNECRLVVDYLQ